jgi:hypothetical protein
MKPVDERKRRAQAVGLVQDEGAALVRGAAAAPLSLAEYSTLVGADLPGSAARPLSLAEYSMLGRAQSLGSPASAVRRVFHGKQATLGELAAAADYPSRELWARIAATGGWPSSVAGRDPYRPSTWGARGDGASDDVGGWRRMIAAIPDGSTIITDPGAVYDFTKFVLVDKRSDTAAVSIDKRVAVIAYDSKFLLGGPPNRHGAFRFNASGSRWLGGTLVSTSNGYTAYRLNENSTRHLGALQFNRCHNIIVQDLRSMGVVTPIRFRLVSSAVIQGCHLENNGIPPGTSAQPVNRSQGITLDECDLVAVRSCSIVGHGEGVGAGNGSTRITVESCRVSESKDNGLYIQGNHCRLWQNTIESPNASCIKCQGSHNEIFLNELTTTTTDPVRGRTGITITPGRTDGDDEPNSDPERPYWFTGEDVKVSLNLVDGYFVSAVLDCAYASGRYGLLRDVTIEFNVLRSTFSEHRVHALHYEDEELQKGEGNTVERGNVVEGTWAPEGD